MANIYLVQRLKSGKKWTAIAGVNATCLAQGDTEFSAAGYPSRWVHRDFNVVWADGMEKQKNYVGKSPLYKEL